MTPTRPKSQKVKLVAQAAWEARTATVPRGRIGSSGRRGWTKRYRNFEEWWNTRKESSR